MTTSICGIRLDDLTQWSEPVMVDGRLTRTGRPSRLWHVLQSAKPKALREAGIFYRKEGNVGWLIQYLDAIPERRVLPPAEVARDPRNIRINEHGLLEWQPPEVRRLVSFWRSGRRCTADLSDTGVGKTYVALALARELGRHIHVVTLKGAIHQWREAADSMGVSCTAINYEGLKTGRHPSLTWEDKKGEQWPVWRVDPARCLLAFDEAQRGKSPDFTLDSRMMIMAAWQKVPCHLMSATIATSPVFMRAAGYILGLHSNADFPQWLEQHGCFRRGGEWYFNEDKDVLRQIHSQLFSTCAVRVRIPDLGDRFPKTMIEPMLVEVDGISKVYADLRRAFSEFQDRAANYSDSKWSYIMAARQRVEFLKVPIIVEMAREAIAEGRAVMVFFNFDAPLKECMKLLKAPLNVITGDTPAIERKRLQKLFQEDKIDVIGLNVESGGTAISLHGKRDRESFINPTFKAATLKQVLGRPHRAGGSFSRQRILFAVGTVEENVCMNVRAKLDNLDMLNDGDTQGNLKFDD